MVDKLPSGPEWICKDMTQEGDLMDENGDPKKEQLELWYRDPVECVRELIGNPMFAKILGYAPTQVYHDPNGRIRHIDEMWTGTWWWKMQVR